MKSCKAFVDARSACLLLAVSALAGSAQAQTGRQQMAIAIRDHPNIILATSHPSGIYDPASTARQNIVDTANCQPARTSFYSDVGVTYPWLHTGMLSAMLRLANDYGYSYYVTEIAGGDHSSTSYHYRGTAFDVAIINGVGVSSANPYYRAFMQRCREMGAVEVLGPGDAGHSTHIHAAWPSGTSASNPGGCAPLTPAKSKTAVLTLNDGRQMVFALANGTAFYNTQVAPNSSWTGWQAMGGGNMDSLLAGKNADGRPEAFCLSGNVPYHNWQTPDGTWSGWYTLHGRFTSFGLGTNSDGRMELFGVAESTVMYNNWQTAPNSGWSGWHSLDGLYLTSAVTANNADGRLELFSLTQDRTAFHMWQLPGGGWSPWASMGGSWNALAVGRNADGRLELFAINVDGSVAHCWQTSPNGSWSGWESMGGGPFTEVKVGRNADGRLEVFALNSTGRVYSRWQNTPNGGWSDNWRDWGGAVNSLCVGQNQNGTLELFAFGSDNASVWHQWQLPAEPWWSGWHPLGTLQQDPLINYAMVLKVSAPTSVMAGQSFTATVTMKNTGSKVWIADGANPHRLGSQNPQDNNRWGLSRVALPSTRLNPNQTTTFTINATAPITPGSYAFAWRMVQEGVEWFGQTAVTNISVVARPVITIRRLAGGAVALDWNAASGTTYRVQYKNSLSGANWSNLLEVRAGGPTASITNAAAAAQRFYRVLLLP